MQIDREKLIEWLKEQHKISRAECERDRASAYWHALHEIESGTLDFPVAEQMREPVLWFAGQMESRLKANDHKGGWGQENCSMNFLLEQMDKKVRRYTYNTGTGRTPEELISQLADIANYAMMQADRLRRCNKSSGKDEMPVRGVNTDGTR